MAAPISHKQLSVHPASVLKSSDTIVTELVEPVALPTKATVSPEQISAELEPSTNAVGLDGASFNVETISEPCVPQQVPFNALA